MTEREWLTSNDPKGMFDLVKEKASDRKLRLFAVACCRRLSGLLTDPWSRGAIDVAEQYADGLAGGEELSAAFLRAQRARDEASGCWPGGIAEARTVKAVFTAANVCKAQAVKAAEFATAWP